MKSSRHDLPNHQFKSAGQSHRAEDFANVAQSLARRTSIRVAAAVTALSLLTAESAGAYDITDKFSVRGVLAGAYQYEGADHRGSGALPFQPELSFRPTKTDEFVAKLGFAVDNAINDTTPFTLAPWGADLENDVKDINGRNRDYLLTAWYKHTFTFDESTSLGFSGGLIDSTDYIDENAYANDEFTQFMNEVFINAPTAFLPSYDLGGSLELGAGSFSARGVVMNVGENDDGNNYWFYGVQLGYTAQTSLGEGNYRLMIDGTNKNFLDPQGLKKETLLGVTLSLDQGLGETFGVFARFGWQQDNAAVDFDGLYSGGLSILGAVWGRPQDNLGIGYSYLSGGNGDVGRAHVFEIYARFVVNSYVALTADLQYMNEKRTTGDVDGWIPGIRLVAEF
jgi:porin